MAKKRREIKDTVVKNTNKIQFAYIFYICAIKKRTEKITTRVIIDTDTSLSGAIQKRQWYNYFFIVQCYIKKRGQIALCVHADV